MTNPSATVMELLVVTGAYAAALVLSVWVSVLLSGENHRQIYVPKGFAHGFVVRSETADFLYKCSDYFEASDDRGVLWNDPGIGIDWQVDDPIISDKDKRYLQLAEIAHDQLPRYQA